MISTELNNQLRHAIDSSDFIGEAESITRALKEECAGLESVAVVLGFMEDHPDFDFGTPGPLTHYIETFYGHGYEAELCASIARRPTMHTVWLLNRVINGTKESVERARLIAIWHEAESGPTGNAQAKRLAAHFLERLST